MIENCDKGPQLERIERKLDRVAEVLTQVAVQKNEIEHIKETISAVPELVRWKERWGGALIGLSILGTICGVGAWLLKLLHAVGVIQ